MQETLNSLARARDQVPYIHRIKSSLRPSQRTGRKLEYLTPGLRRDKDAADDQLGLDVLQEQLSQIQSSSREVIIDESAYYSDPVLCRHPASDSYVMYWF